MHHRRFWRFFCFVLLIVTFLFPAQSQGTSSQDPGLTQAIEQATIQYLGGQPATGIVISFVNSEPTWAHGTVVIPVPADRDASPTAFLFVAVQRGETWDVGLDPMPRFATLAQEIPELMLGGSLGPLISNPSPGPSAGTFSLPWATGETWTLSGGPHGDFMEAIDFTGGSGIVRASHEGVAYVPCPGMVMIYHNSGWQTGYYHLVDVPLTNGQPVSRGQVVGRISMSAGCGGFATGPHVHFWVQRSGVAQPIAGKNIGGWVVQNGPAPYLGCMVKGHITQCAGQGQIYNDGTVSGSGSGTTPAAPAEGIIVRDSGDPNVERGGTQAYFFTAPGSSMVYNGHATWTASSNQMTDNYIKWKPPLDRCGLYEVFAYIPWINNGLRDTTRATYQIRHRHGNSPAAMEATRVLNQEEINNRFGSGSGERWHSLGTFLWSANAGAVGEYVLLTDRTDEPDLRSVNYDDMRWVFRGTDEAACASSNTSAPNAPNSPFPVIVRDAGDPNVERHGEASFFYNAPWGSVTNSEEGTWTYSSATQTLNFVKWKPPLDRCGFWEVFAYMPWVNNGLFDTNKASYILRHRGNNTPAGAETVKVVDQAQVSGNFGPTRTDRWHSLGTYVWSKDAGAAGEYVLLSDHTGEIGVRSVNFDDMRWVFRGESEAACK